MNTDWNDLIQKYISGIATGAESQQLADELKTNDALADLYVKHIGLEVALESQAASTESTRELITAPLSRPKAVWHAWRPLTAAAAGIVFGMLCTSVVFGFVTQRAAMKRLPLMIFDAGLENVMQQLKDGLPNDVGQWGMDDANVVPAEHGVIPAQGEHMLRLEPIQYEKPVKNHASRAYQVLDLRSLPADAIASHTHVELSASFCSATSDASSRYLLRAIALDEAPTEAMERFWSKVENDGVVSQSQRFDTAPGITGWQRSSMTLRLPPGSKTLVIIFGAVPPEDKSRPASVHYLDDVQVSLLSSENSLP